MEYKQEHMSKWLSTGKFNEKDEYYTPKCLVKAIIPFVNPKWTVWCPFDTEDSEFVINLRKNGNTVLFSHIWNGQDFFTYEPDIPYDAIISNERRLWISVAVAIDRHLIHHGDIENLIAVVEEVVNCLCRSSH